MQYTVYFDSGSTNSRLYLLREDLSLQDVCSAAVGSKNSDISGSRDVLVNGLYGLYQQVLTANRLTDADVAQIYASGTITTKSGLYEVPHVELPISFRDFAKRVTPVFIERAFQREIRFIPGLRTAIRELEAVNHVRGEEIEVLGVAGQCRPEELTAIVLPGSHTHTIFARGEAFVDILSTFTGELFAAMQKETSLAPELRSVGACEPDEEMLTLGLQNVREYGINRAIYMTISMRVLALQEEHRRASYLQGVLLGGFAQALEQKCAKDCPDLNRLLVLGDRKLGSLYQKLLNSSTTLPQPELLEKTDQWIPACEGIKAIIRMAE